MARERIVQSSGESASSSENTLAQPLKARRVNRRAARRSRALEAHPPVAAGASPGGGRGGTRTRLTAEQAAFLTQALAQVPYPSASRIDQLAAEAGLGAHTVRIWFQNKRAKHKRLMRKAISEAALTAELAAKIAAKQVHKRALALINANFAPAAVHTQNPPSRGGSRPASVETLAHLATEPSGAPRPAGFEPIALAPARSGLPTQVSGATRSRPVPLRPHSVASERPSQYFASPPRVASLAATSTSRFGTTGPLSFVDSSPNTLATAATLSAFASVRPPRRPNSARLPPKRHLPLDEDTVLFSVHPDA